MTIEHPKLTLELVRSTMDEIVKENPDRVVLSTGCRYAASAYEGPSCVVGFMLFHLGWTYAELKALDHADRTEYGGTTIQELVYADYVDSESKATAYMQVMQAQQDRQKPWLDAYRTAESDLS